MASSALEPIRDAIERQPLVDTHEHFYAESFQNAQRLDLFSSWLVHYASADLVSAGMPLSTLVELRDSSRPLDERWAKFAPYWEHSRTTGYGRALLIAARDLYGVEDINERSWLGLSEAITASNRPGWYRQVLRERAGIEVSILDVRREGTNAEPTFQDVLAGEVDDDLFVRAVRFTHFITPSSRRDLRDLERATSRSIHSVDDLVRALEVAVDKVMERGQMVAMKNALAYNRTLVWEKATHHDAEVAFGKVTAYLDEVTERKHPTVIGASWVELKPLQDYMMHQTIRLAIEHGVPMQIHTGLQEGNGNVLANARPTGLTNLFLEYPEARFDLFHAGYPYSGEVAALAKNFSNVYADLCWVHIISPTVGQRVLREWIETIPGNKIFAFGGDYRFVEGAYAHARMARACVTRVLTEAVDDGYLDLDEALALARKLLHDNAAEFFRIDQIRMGA